MPRDLNLQASTRPFFWYHDGHDFAGRRVESRGVHSHPLWVDLRDSCDPFRGLWNRSIECLSRPVGRNLIGRKLMQIVPRDFQKLFTNFILDHFEIAIRVTSQHLLGITHRRFLKCEFLFRTESTPWLTSNGIRQRRLLGSTQFRKTLHQGRRIRLGNRRLMNQESGGKDGEKRFHRSATDDDGVFRRSTTTQFCMGRKGLSESMSSDIQLVAQAGEPLVNRPTISTARCRL